jgi:CRISPR-associated protein Csb2
LLLPKGVARADRDEAAAALGAVDHISVGGSHIALRHQPSHQPPPIGIERRTWARASTTWATATPIVLDRHPKRGQTVEGLIADACERWGYPRPTAVDVSPFSPLRGVPVAQAFRPRNRGRWTHAVIEWSKPQSGPVLLGREQHFGLGLLRPMASRSGDAP